MLHKPLNPFCTVLAPNNVKSGIRHQPLKIEDVEKRVLLPQNVISAKFMSKCTYILNIVQRQWFALVTCRDSIFSFFPRLSQICANG